MTVRSHVRSHVRSAKWWLYSGGNQTISEGGWIAVSHMLSIFEIKILVPAKELLFSSTTVLQ